MDFSRFLSLVSRWRRVVFACTVLAALAGWGVTLILPPAYESRSVVLVGSALSSVTVDREQLEVSRQLTETYAAVAMSRPLLERVAAQVGVEASDLEITVTPEQDPPVINVTAIGSTPAEAAATANAVITELISASPSQGDREAQSREFIERQLAVIEAEIQAVNEEIDRLLALNSRTVLQSEQLAAHQARLTNLQTTYASLLTASARRGSNVLTVVEEAVPDANPVSPHPAQNALLAAVVGFTLSLVFVLLRERFQETIKSTDEAEAAIGLPTIGVVPRLSGVGGRSSFVEAPGSAGNAVAREAFGGLQANLELLAGSSLSALLVTSANPGEGKTTVAVNLAAAFARTGRRVVLVDGDLQHPAVHRHFNAHHRYGVSDYLRSSIVDPADLLQDTAIDHLRILPAGQTTASGLQLMGSPRTRDLIHRLNAHADLIVIDGPSIIGVSETAMVASFVDATLLVVNAGVTRRPSLEAGRDALTSVGAPIVGTVLNDARGSHATRVWVPPWLGRRDSDRPQVREGGS